MEVNRTRLVPEQITEYILWRFITTSYILAVGSIQQVECQQIILQNGINWSNVGNGTNNRVFALEVYNNELYVGGLFDTVGGAYVNHLAKWNGSNWLAVGNGLNGQVNTLYSYKNNLYIGGYFTIAGSTNANKIAVFDGNNYLPMGSGFNDAVCTITSYNNEIIAGGYFTQSDVNIVNYIAKWKIVDNVEQTTNEDIEVIASPNPFYESVMLQINNNSVTDCDINIYNTFGKDVKFNIIKRKNMFVLNRRNIPNGIYFYKIVFINNNKINNLTGKLIVQ